MDIYHFIKLILTIIYIACSLISFFFLIWWLVMFLSGNPDKAKRKKIAYGLLISIIISTVCIVTHFIVAFQQYS